MSSEAPPSADPDSGDQDRQSTELEEPCTASSSDRDAGDHAAAVADVEEPSVSPGLDETEDRVRSILDLLARGDVARDSGRYRDAATFYGEALAVDPENTVLRLQCAQMFAEAGESSSAERHHLEAVRLAPEDSEAALRLGRFYKEAGRIKQASAAFESARKLSPNLTEPADELAQLFRQGWRGGAAEGEPAANTEPHSWQGALDRNVRSFDEAVSQLHRATAGNRLIPEIVPRTPAEMMVSHEETIELLSFGRRERSHWGMDPTFRGVEAIRGFCLSLSPFTELQISLNGALIHRGPLRGGYPVRNEKNKGGLLKYVFNVWVDFSQFVHGLYELELRFVLSDRQARVRHERVVIAEPLLEQDHPYSDGVISLPVADARSVDDQINSRPSTVRGFARTTLPQAIQNVLVLRTDQLGDLVTSIPALRRLRELLPHSNIVGLLTSSNVDLAATLGLFDEVIVANFPEDAVQGRRTMSLEDQEDLRARLAPYRFDLAMDLSVSGMSRILLLLSGARILYGVDSGEWPWLTAASDGTTHDIKNRREVVPHSTRILAFIERLGTMLASKAEVIRRTDLSRERLKSTFGLKDDKSFVVLHSGARIRSTRWSGYVELAALLIESTGLTVVLISDEPLTRGTLPASLAESNRLLIIDQRLPFDDFDTLVHFCTAFVGNDSGPKHLASLRGAKVVSIHSVRVNWSEWGQELGGLIISRKVPCAGCTIYFDENECGRDFDCISNIGVEEVMAALMRQVGSAPLRESRVSDPVASDEADELQPFLGSSTEPAEPARHPGWPGSNEGLFIPVKKREYVKPMSQALSPHDYRFEPVATFLSATPLLDVGTLVKNQSVSRAIGLGVSSAGPGGSATELIAADESQAVVFAGYKLQDMANYRAALQSWYRAVQVGGHLVVVVPHAFLHDRKTAPPSPWRPAQRRLYTPRSLLDEVEEALVPNTYRVRLLCDCDRGYDYGLDRPIAPTGRHDIVLVLERIAAPAWSLVHEPEPVEPAPDYAFEPNRTRSEVASTYAHQRIVILKLDHLGDFIVGIPALEKARAVFPDAEITLVVGSWNFDMAVGLGVADHVLSFDAFPRNSSEEKVDVSGKHALFDALITSEYDIAIDLRSDHDTRFLLQNVRAKIKAGIGTKSRFEFLDVFLPIDHTRNDPETARVDVIPPKNFSARGFSTRNDFRVAFSPDEEPHGADALMWGPYWNLRPGRYMFEPFLEFEKSDPGYVICDVALDAECVALVTLPSAEPARLWFTVERANAQFEFRIWQADGECTPTLSFYGGRLIRQGASSVLHQSEYLSLLIELVSMRVTRFGVLHDREVAA